jgi:hypothetical protein
MRLVYKFQTEGKFPSGGVNGNSALVFINFWCTLLCGLVSSFAGGKMLLGSS